jgi:hypothetical protein
MQHSQKLNDAAKAVLDEYGYSVDILVDKGWDRRDFDPDYVVCKLAKDGQLMFRTEFRTELNGEYDPTGASVVDDCLDIRTKPAYREQSHKFGMKIAELLKLKREHKFTHIGEKRELKAECEKLMAYRETFAPLRSSGVYANIPLIEENEKELAEIAQQIREAVKAQQEAVVQEESKTAETPAGMGE